jgi:hypothetical protein
VFGYSQVAPQRRQSLAEVRSELKSLALADLVLNIQADVTSSISSQQQFINNDETQQTEIMTAATTSLRVFDLSIDTYIDQKTCTAFGRVSFARSDVPFVVAVAEIRRYSDSLDNPDIDLREIEKLEALVLNLERTARKASVTAQAQLASFKPELVQIRTRAIEKEAALQLATLSALDAHPEKQLAFLARLLSNLETLEARAPLSPYQLNGRQQAEARRAEINSILRSNRVSVFWDASNQALNAALVQFVDENKNDYWRPKGATDEKMFLDVSADFQITRSIIFKVETMTARKYGIDEVDIRLQIRRLGNDWGATPRAQTIDTKAVGRAISDAAIADKIRAAIEQAL